MDQLIRLPQDVGPERLGDNRGVPDLEKLRGDVGEYVTMRARLDDHETRALGCWGLVARWPASREAVESMLQSSRNEDIEDAAGILGRVGIPDDLLARVLSLIEALPDSTARDCLVESLPPGHPRRAPEAVPALTALQALANVPLRGAWEPYTSRIQFIEARFDKVTKQFSRWMRTLSSPALLARLGLMQRRSSSRHEMSIHRGSLETLLPLLDPFWWPTKRLIVETQGGWTAVFSNGHDTYEASVLSERMRVRGVVTDFSADVVTKGEVWNHGNTLFELWDKGESVRTIQLSRQESGWDVTLLGTQQAFEVIDRYQARLKRERFDLEMLNLYCSALGINRSDDRFYGPRALLDVQEQETPQQHRYPTAAAWRAANLFPRREGGGLE